ncbi:MAG: site-2 protease family protein [Planctomycetota bacterium]
MPPDLDELPVDYLAPFETFQAYSLRRGTIYRGRIRERFASDRGRLEQVLGAAPGSYRLEDVRGRLYATLRVGGAAASRRRLWVNAVLLGLTAVTALAAGADLSGAEPRGFATLPFEFAVSSATHVVMGEWHAVVENHLPTFLGVMTTGAPYAAALLFVLIAHELGHYLAARRYDVDATLPFFIPAPFFFGTCGAIIRMRSPIPHRRALFDVGVAGPLAGLAASFVVCCAGLGLSSYGPPGTCSTGPIVLQHSLLFRGLARLVLGAPDGLQCVQLHPVAIAGWFGLFVTFLNLMPVGQLDGGHVWYALLGRAQGYVGLLAIGGIVAMGLRFPGWLLLALLIVVLLRVKHPPVLDESVRPGWKRWLIGALVALIFLGLFIVEPVVVR